MDKLPNDVILHISGFYGRRIPSDLSKEINQKKILYAIKENEYYNHDYNIWNIRIVLNKLQDNTFVSESLREMSKMRCGKI